MGVQGNIFTRRQKGNRPVGHWGVGMGEGEALIIIVTTATQLAGLGSPAPTLPAPFVAKS